jgi:hypothetical protein
MEVATTCGAVVSEEVGEDRGAGRRETVCGTLGGEDAGTVTIASNPNFWEHSCTMQHGSTSVIGAIGTSSGVCNHQPLTASTTDDICIATEH